MKKVSTRTEQQLCMLTILTYAAVAAQLNDDNSWRLRRRLGGKKWFQKTEEKDRIRDQLKKILPDHFDFTVVRWPGTDSKDAKDLKYKRSGCYATSYLVKSADKSNSGFPKRNCWYVIQVCNEKNICPVMGADEGTQVDQFKQKCKKSLWFKSQKLQSIVPTVEVDPAVHEKKGCPQWIISEYGLDTKASEVTLTLQDAMKIVGKQRIHISFTTFVSLFEVYIDTITCMHNELGIAWGDGHPGNILIKKEALFSGQEIRPNDISFFDWDRCEKLAGKTENEKEKLLQKDSDLFCTTVVAQFADKCERGQGFDKMMHFAHRIEGKTFPQIRIELQKARWTESEYINALFSVAELAKLSFTPGLNDLAVNLRENCELYTGDYECASLKSKIVELLPKHQRKVQHIFQLPVDFSHIGVKPKSPAPKAMPTNRSRSLSAPVRI